MSDSTGAQGSCETEPFRRTRLSLRWRKHWSFPPLVFAVSRPRKNLGKDKAGLAGLKHNTLRGGEYGQRWLTAEQLTRLGTMLEAEAMLGSEVGSGWTVRAVIHLVQERFARTYSQSGMRKISMSQAGGEGVKIPRPLLDAFIDALCYAA